MNRMAWKKWLLATFSGSVLLQTTGCAESAIVVTALASVVSATGVVYLVRKVIE